MVVSSQPQDYHCHRLTTLMNYWPTVSHSNSNPAYHSAVSTMSCFFSKYFFNLECSTYMNISSAKNRSVFAFAIRNVFTLTIDDVKTFSTKRLSAIWMLI